MILHHIQTSPSLDSALATCLRYASKQDAVLLSGNAVNAILRRQWIMALSPFKVYILQDDIVARGLQGKAGHYNLINYDEFVELTLKFTKTITW